MKITGFVTIPIRGRAMILKMFTDEGLVGYGEPMNYEHWRVVAQAVDSIKIALDSMTKYPLATGRNGEFYKEALALLIKVEEKLEEPGITPEKTCTGKPVGSSCWMVLANQPKCHVWNPNLQKNETMTWSGECSGGFAQGKGTLIRKYSSGNYEKIEESTGHFQKGKKQEHWVEDAGGGNVKEGPFVDDKKHGTWIIRYVNGSFEKETYVNGEKQ